MNNENGDWPEDRTCDDDDPPEYRISPDAFELWKQNSIPYTEDMVRLLNELWAKRIPDGFWHASWYPQRYRK